MHVKKILATVLVGLPVSAAMAATYYSVVPLVGRTGSVAPKPELSVSLAASSLPAGIEGETYSGFDFKQVLSVTGDSAFQSSDVSWSIAPEVPPGLTFSNGLLSGVPTTATAGGGHLLSITAAYKDKQGTQSYQLPIANGSCRPGKLEYRTGGFSRFTMPKYCTTLTVKAWGAGGGYMIQPFSKQESYGGGGGAVVASFKIQPGTALTAVVPIGQVTSYGTLYGGKSILAGSYDNYGGAGAVVYQGSTILVVAGGGGGGGFSSGQLRLPGIGGGSSTAPRSSSSTGEAAANVNGTYHGAGGGGYPTGGGRGTNLGAQGGASYVAPTALSSNMFSGNGTSPGNASDPDNQGAGFAYGDPGYVGIMGGIVLQWSE